MGEVMGPNEESLEITGEQVDLFLEWFKRFSRCDISCFSLGVEQSHFNGIKDKKNCKVIVEKQGLHKTEIKYDPEKKSIIKFDRKKESLSGDFVPEKEEELNQESLKGIFSRFQKLFPRISASIESHSRVISEAVKGVISQENN